MKSVFKLGKIASSSLVNTLRQAVGNSEGVIACQVCPEKNEISVVYDDYFIKEEDIIEAIEEAGFIVI